MRSFLFMILIVLTSFFFSCPFSGPPSEGEVSEFTLSSASGTEYRIQVWTPPGLANDVPVLYTLDGDETFGKTAALAWEMISDGKVLPFVVVAIGYEGQNDRTDDYTPTIVDGEGGKVTDFVDFVAGDLATRIQTDYPVLLDRSSSMICGHSFGGLAVLDALYRHSDAFSGFFSSSPSLWWDSNIEFSRVDNFLSLTAPTLSNCLLTVSVGSHEGGGMNALHEAFIQRLFTETNPFFLTSSFVISAARHWDCRYRSLEKSLSLFPGVQP